MRQLMGLILIRCRREVKSGLGIRPEALPMNTKKFLKASKYKVTYSRADMSHTTIRLNQ